LLDHVGSPEQEVAKRVDGHVQDDRISYGFDGDRCWTASQDRLLSERVSELHVADASPVFLSCDDAPMERNAHAVWELASFEKLGSSDGATDFE
jgi:hypothetical protein